MKIQKIYTRLLKLTKNLSQVELDNVLMALEKGYEAYHCLDSIYKPDDIEEIEEDLQ